MKRLLSFSALFSLLLLLGACSSSKVVTEPAPGTYFGQYRFFAWGESDQFLNHPFIDNPELNRDIQNAINNELKKDGLAFASQTGADLIVTYQVIPEEGSDISANYNRVYGYRWRNRDQVVTIPTIQGMKPGTLVIDLIDANTNRLAWRGYAEKGQLSAKKADAGAINELVAKILAKFPPES